MRVKKAIKIFEKIRDLPYGTSGSDEVWSCYQKCVLLKQELQHIGITSQLLIGVFDWQDLPIPEHVLSLRRQRHERHVILRVFIDGSTYDIDPSIDIGLAPTSIGMALQARQPWRHLSIYASTDHTHCMSVFCRDYDASFFGVTPRSFTLQLTSG